MITVCKVRVWPAWHPPRVWYIGRPFGGWPGSDFHNPFHLGKDGNRAEVLAKFAAYWYAPEQAALRQRALRMPEDQILGCWCHPLPCHGHIIAGYINWKRQEASCKESLLF